MKFLSILYLAFLVACKSAGNKNSEDASLLRFNGIYQSGVQTNNATGDKNISYLRFYSDGSVINASSTGSPQQIKSWFVKGHENVSEAGYTVAGDRLQFTFGNSNDSVSYDGEILSKEKLQLHFKNGSNNKGADILYSFVADE